MIKLVNKCKKDLIIMINNPDDPTNKDKFTLMRVMSGKEFALTDDLVRDGKVEIRQQD